jgi:hypothetical protein
VPENWLDQKHLLSGSSKRGKNMAENTESQPDDRRIGLVVRIVHTVIGSTTVDLIGRALGQDLASTISRMVVHPTAPYLLAVTAIAALMWVGATKQWNRWHVSISYR